MKIISGGQTGVDRAALDFALRNHLPCGGWCPKGRLAEDGPISEEYPLQETASTVYAERTRMNVEDSDGTLILYQDELSGGTKYTAEYAAAKEKPLLQIDIGKDTIAFRSISVWIEANHIKALNIAGPRESACHGIYDKAFDFLEQLFGNGK
jgi:nucleoside 2-deoxyribosyltransferase